MIRRAAPIVAAGLAFASAATTAYWVLGGTALLDTVGGYAENLARSRTATALVVGILVVGIKVIAGLLALWLAEPEPRRRLRVPLQILSWLGGGLLTVYGGLLVAVGALILTGALHPDGPVDRRVLTWHVALWDLWFLVWGVALLAATWRFSRSGRSPRS